MKKCYNMGIFYLWTLMVKLATEGTKSIDGLSFNCLTFAEKKDVLKKEFEKAVLLINDHWIKPEIELAEQVPEQTLVSRPDIEKFKSAYEITSAVKSAITYDGEKALGMPTAAKKLFKCFLHEDKTPSMNYLPEVMGFHCFGCAQQHGAVIDVFNLASLVNEWSGKGPLKFADQIDLVANLFVNQSGGWVIENLISDCPSTFHQTFIKFTKEMNKTRKTSYLNLVEIKNDKNGIDYLASRGISVGNANSKAVMVCYPTDLEKKFIGRAYLTFINGNGSYVRRLFKEDIELSAKCSWPANKWWNAKGKEMGVFNEQIIDHCQKYMEICFVCESAMDALSCEELGFHAVAINGTENTARFLNDIATKSAARFVCLSDNDNPGFYVAQQFKDKGYFVPDHLISKGDTILSKYKDINECLMADRSTTQNALLEIQKKANAFYLS